MKPGSGVYQLGGDPDFAAAAHAAFEIILGIGAFAAAACRQNPDTGFRGEAGYQIFGQPGAE
jgi:hypothetical protein